MYQFTITKHSKNTFIIFLFINMHHNKYLRLMQYILARVFTFPYKHTCEYAHTYIPI